jgi:trk system potassium uptake protein
LKKVSEGLNQPLANCASSKSQPLNQKRRIFIRARRFWLDSKAFLEKTRKLTLQIVESFIPLFLLLSVGLAIYDFGFKSFWSNSPLVNLWMGIFLNILIAIMGLRLLLDMFKPRKKWVRIFNVFGWVFILFLAYFVLPQKIAADPFSRNFLVLKIVLYSGVLLALAVEISYLLQFIYKGTVSPALLFVGSFFFLIFLGAFFLKLPNATTGHLSALDALFTATSAVCVTGLVVVDTATQFTTFGKLIIMVLIQIGGLGIMTFAGLFAYAVTGGSSIKSRMAFRDVMSGREISNIMKFVYQVVVVTFLFEAIGAVSIYFSIDDQLFPRQLDKLFFCVFHAISAFCNAGFSTYSNGLYEPVIRFNYALQFFIALLIILGGMGFPIVFNLSRYIKIKIINLFYFLAKSSKRIYFPRVINLNSRLALVVSVTLLILGFIAFLVFEHDASLTEHPTWVGKLVTSFFGSVTPRTAGFNTIDMASISLPMLMIYILMMWIGASPGSTGGGIKTTTAGLAVLNMVSVLKGKDRTEFFRSEISHASTRRAFAVIFMSLLFIGLSVFLITVNDSEMGLIKIAFEAFSAFSTVGLSLGITADLAPMSKTVLMVTMFVGRVGAVTLMVTFIRQTRTLNYRYPKEEVTL